LSLSNTRVYCHWGVGYGRRPFLILTIMSIEAMTEEFVQSCNAINYLLFRWAGIVKTSEELYNWGVRGKETGLQLRQMAEEYLSYLSS
jgi:hypothetical protein